MGAERDVHATPMHSPINWALLGLIIDRPSYAYELAQRFDRTYEGVLALSSVSHVYTALAALKSRLLIEDVAGNRGGRQARQGYRATAAGVDGYREWLIAQVGEDRRRQRLFVLQLAALTRNPHAALEIVERYEQACLTEASRQPLAGSPAAAVGTSAVLSRLIAEDNRLAVGAKLNWIEYARRELKSLLSAAPRR
jgi:DNA-binding PadR family transcriptional regulator